MMHIKVLSIALLTVLVKGEPPVQGFNYQSNNYPSNTYLPPKTGYTPTNSYLPPTSGGYSGNSYDHDHSHGHGHGHGHENEVPKSYEFGYSVKDAKSGNDYDRRESSDGNVVRGEYRVQLPDGRTQIVTYHADWQTGFHADVRYEGEARYPEPQQNTQNGYNYNAPDYSSYYGNSYKPTPSTAYGPPGYH